MKNAIISFGHPKMYFKLAKWLVETPQKSGDSASLISNVLHGLTNKKTSLMRVCVYAYICVRKRFIDKSLHGRKWLHILMFLIIYVYVCEYLNMFIVICIFKFIIFWLRKMLVLYKFYEYLTPNLKRKINFLCQVFSLQ